VDLYRRACDGDDARACTSLGWMAENGLGGLPRDDARAAALYKKGCDGDDATGCNNYGVMTEGGRGGLPKDDRAAVELFAHLVGLALERVVLRSRLADLSAEVRQYTASVNALAREALEAPISSTSDYGAGALFPTALLYPAPSEQLSELLTDREREIASLMVSGRSNRDIGEHLHLSPDTVKAYVARVLRKLGAANRVEAVARYLSLVQSGNATSHGS
jgi:DNA-binding NarL/FixJ family response regulator